MAPYWQFSQDGATRFQDCANRHHRNVKLPTLTCEACGQGTLLPFRTLTGADLPQPYWPDDEHLTLVCDRCSHLQDFLHEDVVWAEVDLPAEDRAFWRVEIRCSDRLCPLPIVAHLQTFSQTSRSALGVALAHAKPTPLCALGHGPASVPYPTQIDFVEWSGGDEYVV